MVVSQNAHFVLVDSCLQDIEANLAKKDAERDRIKERHDQPGAVAKDIELNDPAMVSRRRRMMLPAPQISEAELQAIARGDAAMDIDGELTEGAGGEATRRLLGDYQTPGRCACPSFWKRGLVPGLFRGWLMSKVLICQKLSSQMMQRILDPSCMLLVPAILLLLTPLQV